MLESKKTYYSISEVCAKTGLEPHVLRYWESEFSQLRPKKNRAGNRAYREKDIDIIRYIKYLLYQEQYTIPGAKKKLSEARDFDMPSQLQLQLLVPPPPPPQPIAPPVTVDPAPQVTQTPISDSQKEIIATVTAELRSILSILK